MRAGGLFNYWRGRRTPINDALWRNALGYCAYAQALPISDRRRLREMASRFLGRMSIEGAAGFEPTPTVNVVVALKACVPILNLRAGSYGSWHDIVVYPGDFRVESEYIHHAGVVERVSQDLCGQTLSHGPMVLSWQTIEEERELIDRDVVIHECAHKLDIVNGDADGFPLLPSGMPTRHWTRTLRAAYDRFVEAVDADADTRLDPYAAADPAEFFAVLSETFFTEPAIVALDFPDVYQQLTQFFRQDPYALLEHTHDPFA